MALFGNKNSSSGKSNLQLENELKQLKLMNMTMLDQLENFKKMSFKYQDDYNKLAKKVANFCYLLLDSQYARNQLGGGNSIKDMNVFQLMDYAEQQYRSNNQKEREFLINISGQIEQKNQEIEGLKAQISRYMLKEKQLKSMEESGEMIHDNKEDLPQQKTEPIKTAPDLKPFASTATTLQTNKPNGIMRMAVIDDDDEPIMPTKPIYTPKNQHPSPPATSVKKPDPTLVSKEEPVAVVEVPVVAPDSKIPVQRVKDIIVTEDKKRADEIKPIQQATSVQTVILEDEEDPYDESILKLKTTVEEKTEQQRRENEVLAHVIDLNNTINQMSDMGWMIVEAIGNQGFSENKDIKAIFTSHDLTESAFTTTMKQLEKMGVVEYDKINTGLRWFFAYELTDLGSRIYLEKYKKSPVECEKQLLKKEHTTTLHGYCIKDTANILKATFGYDEAITDRRSNSMKLYNGQTYIPDVVAKKKEGAIVDYVEVELGHHMQKDFNAKCDKMRMVSKNLFFVVPDADTMNKILVKQIGQWVLEKGGKERLKDTTIYLTPLKSLSKGKWETVYPF